MDGRLHTDISNTQWHRTHSHSYRLYEHYIEILASVARDESDQLVIPFSTGVKGNRNWFDSVLKMAKPISDAGMLIIETHPAAIHTTHAVSTSRADGLDECKPTLQSKVHVREGDHGPDQEPRAQTTQREEVCWDLIVAPRCRARA